MDGDRRACGSNGARLFNLSGRCRLRLAWVLTHAFVGGAAV